MTTKPNTTKRKPGRPPKVDPAELPEYLDLKPTERKFAEEYTIDGNKTQSAIRAGYAKGSAHVSGHNLYKRPKVKAYIDYLMRERSRRTKSSADRVIQELERIAFFDIRELHHPDGRKKTITELNDDQVAAISDVEFFATPKPKKKKEKVSRNNGKVFTRKVQEEKPDLEIERVIKRLSRYNKMEALKMLGAFHGVRLDSQKGNWTPEPDPPSGDNVIKSFEEMMRNLNVTELEETFKLLTKAFSEQDSAGRLEDNQQSQSGEKPKTIH